MFFPKPMIFLVYHPRAHDLPWVSPQSHVLPWVPPQSPCSSLGTTPEPMFFPGYPHRAHVLPWVPPQSPCSSLGTTPEPMFCPGYFPWHYPANLNCKACSSCNNNMKNAESLYLSCAFLLLRGNSDRTTDIYICYTHKLSTKPRFSWETCIFETEKDLILEIPCESQ